MKNAFRLLVLIGTFASYSVRAQNVPDTFSPVVSFQYQDSLTDPTAQTPINSPVVSFQYYDWLGDENLTFQNSPAVSYFYYFSGGLTLTGTVSTPAGVPVPGAQITFKRVGAPFPSRRATATACSLHRASPPPRTTR